MKNNIFVYIVFLIIALFVSSCSKEDFEEPNGETVIPTETSEANSLLGRTNSNNDENDPQFDETMLWLDCISIPFPFEVVDNYGKEYEINTADEFFDVYQMGGNENDPFIVDFVYPLGVINAVGELTEVESGEGLGELFAACVPDGGWTAEMFPAYLIGEDNSCYILHYPITIETENGDQITVHSESEFIEEIAKELYSFVFPFQIDETDGGATIDIINVDDLFEALASCNDFGIDTIDTDWIKGLEYVGCYKILFPINVKTIDGDVLVNDEEAYADLLLQGKLIDFVYPITLEDEKAQSFTVNTEDELISRLNECGEPWDGEDQGLQLLFEISTCLEVQFPISIYVHAEESPIAHVTVNSFEDAFNQPFTGELVYPIQAVIRENGDDIQLNSNEEIMDLWEECDEPIAGNYDLFELLDGALANNGEAGCYEIVFPITVFVGGETGGSIEEIVNNINEIEALHQLTGEVLYPLVVIKEGEMIDINNSNDLYELVNSCNTNVDDLFILLMAAQNTNSEGDKCFTINYPIRAFVIDENGNEIAMSFQTEEDIQNSKITGRVVYPVFVTLADSSIVELIEIAEIFELLNNCN